MSKLSIKSKEFLYRLLDKQVERYGVTWEECEEVYKKSGVPAYEQYSFKTEDEFNEWKNFCINEMRKSKEKIPKKTAEDAFMWFNLNYGLKQDYA
jgi:hypothetical protein